MISQLYHQFISIRFHEEPIISPCHGMIPAKSDSYNPKHPPSNDNGYEIHKMEVS